jgi:hypothetical protein
MMGLSLITFTATQPARQSPLLRCISFHVTTVDTRNLPCCSRATKNQCGIPPSRQVVANLRPCIPIDCFSYCQNSLNFDRFSLIVRFYHVFMLFLQVFIHTLIRYLIYACCKAVALRKITEALFRDHCSKPPRKGHVYPLTHDP